MRQLIIVLLSFYGGIYLSAQTTLTGTITDTDDGLPLLFATVATTGLPYGTLSETDGTFRLSSPVTLPPETTISISYLGFETKVLSLSEVQRNGNISLERVNVGLPTVSVSASAAGPLTEIELGRREKKARTFYQSIFEQTYQLASRVANPGQKSGILTQVRYYFGKAAKKGKPVRLNFYAVDPACDCPGAPLHASSIIPEKTKSGWNKLDLTPYAVELPPGDLFVSFEWLGLSTMQSGTLNFSVGIIYDKDAAPLYEKLGGTAWTESSARGSYRPLVRVEAKVE